MDVSKKKLDFCVMFEGKVVHEEETANHQNAISPGGIAGFLRGTADEGEMIMACYQTAARSFSFASSTFR